MSSGVRSIQESQAPLEAAKHAASMLREIAEHLEAHPECLVQMDAHLDPYSEAPHRTQSVKVVVLAKEQSA